LKGKRILWGGKGGGSHRGAQMNRKRWETFGGVGADIQRRVRFKGSTNNDLTSKLAIISMQYILYPKAGRLSASITRSQI